MITRKPGLIASHLFTRNERKHGIRVAAWDFHWFQNERAADLCTGRTPREVTPSENLNYFSVPLTLLIARPQWPVYPE